MKNEIGEQHTVRHENVQILIVDDSGFSRALINKELNAIGIEKRQIWQACSGEDALKEMERIKFDLFILDIVLTEMNGIAVLKEVKKMQPHAKIVMCSGCNSDDLIKESVQRGIDAFIVKPYKSDLFKKVIGRVLGAEIDGCSDIDDAWIAKCYICDRQMIEIDSIDMVSFFCPQNCMKIGPMSTVLVTQVELDQDYKKAKNNK